MTEKLAHESTPETPTSSAPKATPTLEEKAARPAFERPTLRKLGSLPRITTAFGGSFSP